MHGIRPSAYSLVAAASPLNETLGFRTPVSNSASAKRPGLTYVSVPEIAAGPLSSPLTTAGNVIRVVRFAASVAIARRLPSYELLPGTFTRYRNSSNSSGRGFGFSMASSIAMTRACSLDSTMFALITVMTGDFSVAQPQSPAINTAIAPSMFQFRIPRI